MAGSGFRARAPDGSAASAWGSLASSLARDDPQPALNRCRKAPLGPPCCGCCAAENSHHMMSPPVRPSMPGLREKPLGGPPVGVRLPDVVAIRDRTDNMASFNSVHVTDPIAFGASGAPDGAGGAAWPRLRHQADTSHKG